MLPLVAGSIARLTLIPLGVTAMIVTFYSVVATQHASLRPAARLYPKHFF
jgi:hypothetical protein